MTEGNGGERSYPLGDRVYRLRPFKGSKGVRAFAIISRVGDRLGDIWRAAAKFEAEYRELNVLVITRDLARYRVTEAQNVIARLEADAARLQSEAVTEKRAEYRAELEALPEGDDHAVRRTELEGALEDLDDAPRTLERIGNAIDAQGRMKDEWYRTLTGTLADVEQVSIPQSPTWEQRTLALFPKVWEVAEDEVTMLLGLVLIEDDALKRARVDGRADEAVRELGEQVLDELELDEVAELMLAAVEYALQRYRPRIAHLEESVARVREILTPFPSTPEETEDQETFGPDRRQTERTVGSLVSRAEESPDPKSSSSTGSPGHTDGTATESSSESSGRTSSPSPS